MHGFIKVIGLLIAGAGILIGIIAVVVAVNSHDSMGRAASIYGVIAGVSIALPGAMLYCFGAIVEHLIAIRRNGEKQLAIFEKLGKPKA